MKKALKLTAGICLVGILAGCINTRTPITGAMAGGIYTSISSGFFVATPVRPLKEKYIVIKENVTSESTSTNIMALVAFGDSSYISAFENMLKQAPGADAIIDIKVDIKKKSILLLYNDTTLVVQGTAIKYIKKTDK
ncbi:MAG: hypothetical protein L3J71_02530 [Victivallaceae bacterium]|nr:hypothetical protein [Victivallaceae bacterium]